jgi:hypothetical protein
VLGDERARISWVTASMRPFVKTAAVVVALLPILDFN